MVAAVIVTALIITAAVSWQQSRWEYALTNDCSWRQHEAALFIYSGLVDQRSRGDELDVSVALQAAIDSHGRQWFVCPTTGDPYQILPDTDVWMRPSAGAIGIFCTDRHHLQDGMIASDAIGNQLLLEHRIRIEWADRAITAGQ
ncbi:MAG: hypothetical protein ACF8R7_10275 [Phycisphaerales bacterium JB039]